MAFGKNRAKQRDSIETSQRNQAQKQPLTEEYIELENEIPHNEDIATEGETNYGGSSDNKKKPLLDEITPIVGDKGKNAGGTKKWSCNHCKKTYSSSYTRIHQHFFGAPVGKKSKIGRCTVMLSNRELLQSIRKKVEKAEVTGISPSLSKSTIKTKIPGTSNSPIGDAFAIVERNEVDKSIVHLLLSQCRESLATTVVMRAWKDWVNSANEDFWDEVDNILAITKLIYLMIKFTDGEGPKMGEVYEKMDCMIGEIGDIMKDNKHKDDSEKMSEILLSRWEKMNIPMHCLGFALNPFFYDSNYLQTPAPEERQGELQILIEKSLMEFSKPLIKKEKMKKKKECSVINWQSFKLRKEFLDHLQQKLML
ncbi:RNA-binding protein MRN1 [Bienertia sinuspersici]